MSSASNMGAALGRPSRAVRRLEPLLAYVRLEILRVARHQRFLILAFGIPSLLYIMRTQLRNVAITSPVSGLPFPAYEMVSMAVLGGAMAGLSVGGARLAAERVSGWARQLRITPLSASTFTLVKGLTALLVTLPAVTLICCLGLALNGIDLTPATWLALIIAMTLGSLPLGELGLALGLLLDTESAQLGTLVASLAVAFLGGLVLPVRALPGVVQLVAPLMPTYPLAQIGWAMVSGRPVLLADVAVLAIYALVFFVGVAWLSRRAARPTT
jgi:ABC-2 type transport system permease protein